MAAREVPGRASHLSQIRYNVATLVKIAGIGAAMGFFSALTLRRVWVKRGGKIVLREIDFAVPIGKRVRPDRASGGGKTTLLKVSF